MLATNHGLAGMIIGATLQPAVAVPVALLSHFFLDMLPHYGINKLNRNKNKFYKKLVFIDSAIALSFAGITAMTGRWDMFWIGWVAYGPDGYWVYLYFKQNKNLNFKIKSKFGRFHEAIQREYGWGLLFELPFATFLFIIFVTLFI